VIYPGGKCKDFQSDLIVMGDLPKWKVQRFSKWSYYNGQHAQVEKCKDFFFQNDEKYKDFSRCSCFNV
jgi:hypothetical protein